jgi:Fe-S cluster biogenesis protein NfuA
MTNYEIREEQLELKIRDLELKGKCWKCEKRYNGGCEGCSIAKEIRTVKIELEELMASNQEEFDIVEYSEPKRGYSAFSGEPVTVIGEQKMLFKHNGRVVEQYIYNIDTYQPKNGKPFIAVKSNIIL